MANKFGKFDSFSDFIESYEADVQKEEHELEADMPMEERVERRRQPREMAEVQALVSELVNEQVRNERHYQLMIKLAKVESTDDGVAEDVQRCIQDQERVFVAIRYGDRMGITEPITDLAVDMKLHMRGEWIPKEKAYAHGGEKLSVLHFTHHPIGFVCTPSRCYE